MTPTQRSPASIPCACRAAVTHAQMTVTERGPLRPDTKDASPMKSPFLRRDEDETPDRSSRPAAASRPSDSSQTGELYEAFDTGIVCLPLLPANDEWVAAMDAWP